VAAQEKDKWGTMITLSAEFKVIYYSSPINESKRQCAAHLKQEVTIYYYPHGSKHEVC